MALDSKQGLPVQAQDAPTPWRLFLIFARIGLTSFGGGMSGWLMREFVIDRPWMTEKEFLDGLSLSQALPGVNVKNMAIWIGYRLAGNRGVIAGFVGILLPPTIVIMLLGLVFAKLAHIPLTHVALAGAAAGAIGLSLTMAITAARRVERRKLPLAILVITFITIALFHWPLVWVVVVGGVINVTNEYLRLGKTAQESSRP